MNTIDLFRKKYLKKAFAFFGVALMMMTAFAGITFIGSTMINDVAADSGTQSNPLSSYSASAGQFANADSPIYVSVGGSVNITSGQYSSIPYIVVSVTDDYGLTVNSNNLTGTISKAGTITVTIRGLGIGDITGTIYAVSNDCTIQFNRGTHGSITYGGNTSQSMTVPKGTVCTINGASLTITGYGTVTGSGQSGYEAYGWSYTGGSGTATSGSFTITQNTTIRLVTKTITNYTVTISAGTGGSVSETSVSVPSGTSISTSGNTLTIGSNTITATANSGYSFSSWSNASGTVTANRTITANFISNGYKVTFDATTNGGTCSTSSLTGSTITLPSASKSSTSSGSTSSSPWTLTTTSYSFDGWYTSAYGGTRVGGAGDSYSPTSAKTLYAHFSSSTSTSYGYKIIYDANGGSGAPNSQTGTSSGTSKNFTIPSTIPTRSGYTFLGWSTSSTATSASYIKSTQYSFGYGQTTLYAVWQQNGTMYYANLAYDANGGSGAPSQQSVNGSYTSDPGSYGFTIPSTTPTRSGYTFLGWSTSSTATSASYSPGSTIYIDYTTSSTSKVTLCAVWQKNDIVFTSSLTVNQAACVRGSTFSYTPTFNTTGVSISVSAKDSGNNTVSLFTVSNGKISCTPSQDGEYSVTVTATKSGWTSATQTFTFYVAEPLGFTSVPSGSIIVTEAS